MADTDIQNQISFFFCAAVRRVVRKVLKYSRKMCFSCGFLGEVVSTKVRLPTPEGTNCSDTLRPIWVETFLLHVRGGLHSGIFLFFFFFW